MYYYIYDDFIGTPKLQVKLAEIESRLALLDIKGPVSRLHTLTNINEIVKRAVTRGATTIIVVGDDRTLLKILNALPDKKIVIGLIALGPQLTLARRLHVETVKAGIEAAAARKLVPVNTGLINGKAFLQQVQIQSGPFTAILDDELTIKSAHPQGIITIDNPQLAFSPGSHSVLAAELAPLRGKWSLGRLREEEISRLHFNKLVLKSQEPITAMIDGAESITDKTITIELVRNAAKLIVGRERPAEQQTLEESKNPR